jgi:hypothetical protein
MKNTQNVKMLSGFSQNLLQYVMNGEVDAQMEEKRPDHKSITPYETMRSMLDDDRYESVRKIIYATFRDKN